MIPCPDAFRSVNARRIQLDGRITTIRCSHFAAHASSERSQLLRQHSDKCRQQPAPNRVPTKTAGPSVARCTCGPSTVPGCVSPFPTAAMRGKRFSAASSARTQPILPLPMPMTGSLDGRQRRSDCGPHAVRGPAVYRLSGRFSCRQPWRHARCLHNEGGTVHERMIPDTTLPLVSR